MSNKRTKHQPLKQYKSDMDELLAIRRENQLLEAEYAKCIGEHRQLLAENVRANQTYLQHIKDNVNLKKENTALKQRFLEQMHCADKLAVAVVDSEVEQLEADVRRQRKHMDATFREGLSAFFSPAQIDLLLAVDEADVQWSADELARARRLYDLGPAAYRMVRIELKFPLPHESLLTQ